MDTDQKTESLADLCKDIERRYVRLPEFQRDFVWEIQKTYDLFDSFVKNIFTGSLIYGTPNFAITVRDLDTRARTSKRGRKVKLQVWSLEKDEVERLVKTQRFRLLLDGQQRATSVYRALLDHDKVYMVIKPDHLLSEEARQKKPSMRTLEEVLLMFDGGIPPGHIGIKLGDAYRGLTGEFGRDKELVTPFKTTLPELAARLKTDQEIEVSPEFDTYVALARRLGELFRAEKLVAYYLLSTSQESFALFFERSNSKGIQLSFIDILAAKLYKGFNLKDHISEFENEFPKKVTVNQEVLVRSVSYIVSREKENRADTSRAFILENLASEHFKEHWKVVTQAYKGCYEYLIKNHMIVSYSWLPYDNMLIPMVAFVREIPHRQLSYITKDQGDRLKLWFWLATMSRRYSSAAQTYVLEDAQALEALAKGNFDPYNALLRKLTPAINSTEDLFNINKKLDAAYQGILNLINYNAGGVTNWQNNNLVSPTDSLDDHHIFPKDFLRKTYAKSDPSSDKDTAIDCVLNRCLIPKFTNIKASNKPPSEYLKTLQQDNSTLEDALTKHLIPLPVELIKGDYDNYYDQFLNHRAEAIMSILKKHVFDERDKLIKPIL